MASRSFALMRQHALIDGKWIDADNGALFEVRDPATGLKLGEAPLMGAAETARAIDAAHAAQPAWRGLTAKARAAPLMRLHALMLQHEEELAALLTAEQGKPLAEARGEIAYAASFIEWFAEEAKRIYGEVVPPHQSDKRILVFKHPVGVVAAITPWNFPAAMITRKIGPALAAGCTVVLKPASQTPFTALAIAALGLEAGLPNGVLNVVTGASGAIGAELTSNPIVRKLSFTGSTEIGKKLLAACAPTMKRVSLELGGNAPFIVFADADLDAAVEAAIVCKFRNTGQTCVCANRLLVQESVHDAFAEKLAARVGRLVVGPGADPGAEQGPLIDENALAKVEEHVADACARGATVLVGGKRHPLGRNFYAPTVLRDARPDMAIAHEETFGPVAALFKFSDEAEAIAIANATDVGLAGYFFTRDVARVFRVSEALECGIVGVNTGLISTEVAPFGGVKHSGLGREGSKHGVSDYLDIKYVCIGDIAERGF